VSAMQQFFTSTDYALSLPMILLSLFGLGILIIDLVLPPEWKRWNAVTALIGLGFAGAAGIRIQTARFTDGSRVLGSFGFLSGQGDNVVGAIRVDAFALYFFYLFLLAAVVAIFMSIRYLEIEREHHGEFYALLLFSIVGMMCMACGYDLVLLFIGLETMSAATYVLVGFLRRDRRSNEASLKYMLLGAFSSGIFAYGLSLLYGLSGSTNLRLVGLALERHLTANAQDPVAILAMLTVGVGLLFKIAAVPFHQWAPDAYEGAPTSITGFMSVAVKAAAWAMLLRVFLYALYPMRSLYVPLLVFVAIATMTGANLAALTQNNLKRLLAYSSIAHVGYMLLGLVASDGVTNTTGIQGILVYLLVYTFMNLGAFAVITSLRRRDAIGDEIDDIAGLFQKAPTEALLMLVFLLSLAGIPPLAGFWGKYFIFLSLIQTQHYLLAAVAVLYAVVSLYYYMRIANAMFMRPAEDTEPLSLSPAMRAALVITGFATVWIGVFPEMFIRAANWGLGIASAGTQVGLLK
jgi:NADH-quinone oxidoreductase subunit N